MEKNYFKFNFFVLNLGDHCSCAYVLDKLYDKLQEIHQNPKLILVQSFMMDIFKQNWEELHLFSEYLEMMFKKEQMKVIS